MNNIYRLDLQGIHVDLIEKFGYKNVHSTYYDVFDNGGQNIQVYLYSEINPYSNFNICNKNFQLKTDGDKYTVTSEYSKYGDFKIKHYNNKELINLLSFKEDFDVYSNLADIIEIIENNCYRMSELDFREEVFEKIKNYMKI